MAVDTDLSASQLDTLCAALGWQGGTYWQVVDEVRRLKIDADKHPAVRAEPELLHLAETCETWAQQVSEQADVRAGIREAGARLTRQLNAAIQRHLAGSAALPPPPPDPLSGETEAQREEVCAAWADLPDSLRCHPGLKRLYRALGGLDMERLHAAVPHRESDSTKQALDDEAFRQLQRDRMEEARKHDAEQAKPCLTCAANHYCPTHNPAPAAGVPESDSIGRDGEHG